jgi:uncharacterized membrane protein YgdD (TMEM256/DUF423 family)
MLAYSSVAHAGYALIAVAAGAFGAHTLKSSLNGELLSTFEVGVRYQMYHALAMMAAGWAQARWPSALVVTCGWFFVIGTILFSGSLYVHSLTGVRWLVAITQLGGLAFLAGWVCLGWAVWTKK